MIAQNDEPYSIASVTVAYNGASVLRHHLASLKGQTRELDEIVVVDNPRPTRRCISSPANIPK